MCAAKERRMYSSTVRGKIGGSFVCSSRRSGYSRSIYNKHQAEKLWWILGHGTSAPSLLGSDTPWYGPYGPLARTCTGVTGYPRTLEGVSAGGRRQMWTHKDWFCSSECRLERKQSSLLPDLQCSTVPTRYLLGTASLALRKDRDCETTSSLHFFSSSGVCG